MASKRCIQLVGKRATFDAEHGTRAIEGLAQQLQREHLWTGRRPVPPTEDETEDDPGAARS